MCCLTLLIGIKAHPACAISASGPCWLHRPYLTFILYSDLLLVSWKHHVLPLPSGPLKYWSLCGELLLAVQLLCGSRRSQFRCDCLGWMSLTPRLGWTLPSVGHPQDLLLPWSHFISPHQPISSAQAGAVTVVHLFHCSKCSSELSAQDTGGAQSAFDEWANEESEVACL